MNLYAPSSQNYLTGKEKVILNSHSDYELDRTVILTNLLRTFGKIVEKGEQSFFPVYWSGSYRSFQGVGYMESTKINL